MESTVEITGASNLPAETSVDVNTDYNFTLKFYKIGQYNYKIKQVETADNIIYDTTIYDVEVLIVNEDGLKPYVSIYKENSTTKEELVAFFNTIPVVNTDLLIYKVSEDDEALSGAELVLINNDESTEIEQWESTDTAKEISLVDGSYTIHEDVAPDGYDVVDDITFTITEGVIELEDTEYASLSENTITIVDPSVVEEEEEEEIIEEETPIKTGDDTNLIFYIIGLVASIVLLTFIYIRRKHAKNL